MLSWWRARVDEQSPTSPAKSPTKGERGSKGSSKGAISFSVSNDPSVLSPSLASSKKASTSSTAKDPKASDAKKGSYNLLQPPDKVPTLSGKDFIVILVEIFMSYCNYVIRKRKSEAHDYNSQLWKTSREIEVDLLFMQGWAALGSLLAGVLADGYIGNFYVALSSIVIIFLMASCLYVEQILIIRIKTNPYAEVMTEVASVAHLFNHSTGFCRVVFALENMRNKKPSAISLLIFIFTISGDVPSSGGILMLIARGARMSTLSLVRLSWWVSGISVLLFVTFFKSIAMDKSYRLASRRAVKCILEGFWHLCTDRCMKVDWKEHMHRKYDKLTLNRAKGLVNYLILLLPIAGFIFISMGKTENLFSRLAQLMTPKGIGYYVGVNTALASCIIITMIVTHFLILPILSYIGYPKQFNYHFSLGNFFALVALYYIALVLKVNEVYDYDHEIGYIRIYNARDSKVTIFPQESFTKSFKHTIPPHSAMMGTYVLGREAQEMLLINVKFDENTNFTTFMRPEAKKCISYAITDPPEIIKLTKEIPLFEGPPGTNDYKKSTIYLFNAARAFGRRTIRFRDLTTGRWILQLVSILGTTEIFQVPPGKYEVWVEGSDLHLHTKFNDGGLYGIMLLADITKGLLELDTVIAEKSLSSTICMGFAIFYGIALTCAYVPLRTMTYSKAPNGLINTAFGCLSAQENFAVWVLVLGYYTWHELIWSDTLLIYCFALTFLFFMSVFIMIRYKQFYS